MSGQATEYLEAYAEHSKVIRTWFVAYGIGAPVLLLTNDALARALKSSGNARVIAGCFLAAVVLQVVLAAANKFSMWGLYYGETNDPFKATAKYRIAFWFSEAFWIDLLIDLATMVLFGLATWRAFGIVLAPS
jgi:hypothetical protein